MLQDIRIRQRDYLISIAQILSQELEMEPLLWQVIQMAVDLVGGESGFVALFSVEKGWQIRTQFNISQPLLTYIETYLAGLSDNSGKVSPVDLLEIKMLIKRIRSINDPNVADGIGFPLKLHEKLIGAIVVFRSYKCSFTPNEKSILQAFTAQAAIAIHNSMLYTENLEEKKRLDAIIRSVADGLMVMDISHKVILTNAALRRILNIPENVSPEQFYNEDLLRFKDNDYGIPLRDAEAGGWPLGPESKHSIQGNCFLYHSEKTIPVTVTYTPVMSTDNSRLLNIIALVRDISKFKEADELKNTFISTVSHELKTPVAIIKGYASTLNLSDADWDQTIIKESLTVIEEESDRLTMMINDLLDASRLNSGTFTLHKSDIDLQSLCVSIARHMQNQAGNNQILTSFPDDFPIIFADEDRIRQVITNFITNAMRYAPGSDILITGAYDAQYVAVSVTDSGPGLSSQDLVHVFDRFYRSGSTKNVIKGTGLGLFLSKAIIEAHGGQISAKNRDDRSGAVFSFRLPQENITKSSTMIDLS